VEVKQKILAFGHKSRVGKDTITKFLLAVINSRRPDLVAERRAFADKVKDISYQLYKCHGLQPAQYYEEHPIARTIKLPTLGRDPVEIWVGVGDKLREVYAETWVDLVLLDSSADIIIISDLRYPNEVARVHELGGVCVRLDKKDAPIRNTKADNALNDYTSWFRVVDNSGEEGALEQKAEELLADLGWLK